MNPELSEEHHCHCGPIREGDYIGPDGVSPPTWVEPGPYMPRMYCTLPATMPVECDPPQPEAEPFPAAESTPAVNTTCEVTSAAATMPIIAPGPPQIRDPPALPLVDRPMRMGLRSGIIPQQQEPAPVPGNDAVSEVGPAVCHAVPVCTKGQNLAMAPDGGPRLVCSLPPTGKPVNWCGTAALNSEPAPVDREGSAHEVRTSDAHDGVMQSSPVMAPGLPVLQVCSTPRRMGKPCVRVPIIKKP